jgi:general secretion pathway protein K
VKLMSLFMPRPELKSALAADGFIIVAVLWILAALAALASVYAVYVGNTAMAARVYNSRLQSEALIAAGLELTAYRLSGFEDASRPTSGAFDFELGRSQVGVAFRSEGARIDLNLAPKTLLSGLCVVLGAKPEDADSYADRIVAWRTKPGPDQNPEIDAYKSAGLNYGPRQAPFQNAAELRLVRGLPAALVDNAFPFVTVFNGRAEIDINEAAPEVVAALPGMNPNLVEAILTRRDHQNPQAVLSLLGAAGSSVAVGGRKATRAAVQITLDSGRQVNADAVLLITENNSPEPYRILAWHDDFDGPV